ncbi:glycosyltransferase family 2 protein [Streptomyces sp. NPDC026673]|uniref:glycosyltransferase family 2 protein n=1 Tax=Streptomyces sp. NPDC026673 TaxID=3155724 RepID=UPI0033C0A4F7
MRKTPASSGGLVPSPATGDGDRSDPGPGPGPALRHDHARFGTLAGPLNDPPRPGVLYRVRYRSTLSREGHRVRTGLLLAAAPLASLALLVWLVQPRHWAHREAVPPWAQVTDTALLVSLGLIELIRLIAVVSHAHATLVARDPVPVAPVPGTRVAFLTPFVPGRDSLEAVRATLEGAVRVRHDGPLDVWLLDEGDDPEARLLCERLGVRHFTRKGVERWNRPKGAFRVGTGHGNHNAWLDAHGADYAFTARVDPGHVPLPNFLERMLGYFRDPDIAFVVGPRVQGNHDTAVARAAEGHRFLFHALTQRAANRYGSAQFVGSGHVIRVSALREAGGLYAPVTGDLATGLDIHGRRNPATGRPWRSVHTPDVLAVGGGPSSWTGFFAEQLHRSRDAYGTIVRHSWKAPWKLRRPGRLFNHALTVAHYPMAAAGWILGGLSCVLFLGLGASGSAIDPSVWLTLYANAAAFRIALCLANRPRNVSPRRPKGSLGLAGMVMSALSAPVYVLSLLRAVLRRAPGSPAMPEGDPARPDRLAAFRVHLLWAAVFAGSLLASVPLGHTHAAMRAWASIALLITLAPLLAWRCSVLRRRVVVGLRAVRRARRTAPGRHRAPRRRTSARVAAARRHLVRR